MPRRSSKPEEGTRLGQVGDWWLQKFDDSPYWYRLRYDPEKRRTVRTSTGCRDFRDAHQSLVEFVAKEVKADRRSPDVVRLYTCLDYYWERHGKGLVSAPTQGEGIAAWKAFYHEKTVLSDLTPGRQDEFIAHLKGKGLALGSISRILSPGRSAINMALDHMLVSAVPKIKECQTQMDKDEVKPKGRPLSVNEFARLVLAQPSHHMHVFMAIMSNTLCRPGAALELTKAQVDFENNRVYLNPEGRRQNNKYRPSVPLTPTLKTVLLNEEARQIAWAKKHGIEDFKFSHYVIYKRQPVNSVKTSWRNMVVDAGFVVEEEGKETREPITPYSIRHTLSRQLKRARMSDTGTYLGHRPKGSARTTAIYTDDIDDPSYLAEEAAVVEAFQQLLREEVAKLTGTVAMGSRAA
jgi:integrase